MKTRRIGVNRGFMRFMAAVAATVLGVATASAAVALSGAGTEGSPYLITSLADLVTFRDWVNATNDCDGEFFQLTADIDMAGVSWTPIGDDGTYEDYLVDFGGTFDGGGHTISNLAIEDHAWGAALFGLVSGTIENLTIANSHVTGSSGGYALFVVIGTGDFTMRNCHAVNSYVSASSSSGLMVSYVDGAGTVVLTNCDTDGDCHATEASGYQIGGMVGQVCYTDSATFSGCTNRAALSGSGAIGGIVGQLGAATKTAVFTGCANTGAITVTGGAKYAGGLVGYKNMGGGVTGLSMTFTDCYNSGAVVGGEAGAQLGGFVGFSNGTDASFTRCVNSGTIGDSTFTAARAAGFIAWENSTADAILFEDCVNSGAMTGTSTGAFGATMPSTITLVGTATVNNAQPTLFTGKSNATYADAYIAGDATTTYFADFTDALAAAASGDTITLLANDLTAELAAGQSVTIDANGHTGLSITTVDGYQVFDNDGIYSSFPNVPVAVWVDGTYTAENSGGHIWEYNAFAEIQDGVVAVGDGGTLNIAAGTYTNNVYVDKSLTIVGAGAAATIVDGGAAGNVFFVDGDIDVAITGLTIQNGAAADGGGIYVQAGIDMAATLAAYDCILKNNVATSGNGGAVANLGLYEAVVLDGCTFSGNTALGGEGGAIYIIDGFLTMANCTVSGNTAKNGGGLAFNSGAAIDLQHITVTLNTATGIASSKGGGLYPNGASGTVSNSIICGNTDQFSGTATDNVNGTIPGGANNLRDQDAMLDDLADNGGPTPTHALLTGSPAINNAGAVGAVTHDQRGVPRDQGNAPDIGAYETVYIAYVDDDYTAESCGGHVWGQDAFAAIQAGVNAVAVSGTVNVAAGTYAGATITRSVTLLGANASVAGYAARAAESIINNGQITVSCTSTEIDHLVEVAGFRFAGTGYTIRGGDPSPTTDFVFRNNLVDGKTPVDDQVTISSAQRWRDVSFLSNKFANIGLNALVVSNVRTLTVVDNDFADVNFNAIQLTGANSINIVSNRIDTTGKEAIKLGGPIGGGVCSYNTILNANTSCGDDRGGIRIRGVTLPYSVTIANNIISNSFNGVAVKDGESLAGATLLVTNNCFVGNSNAGVYNGGTETLVADGNYWGEATPNMVEHIDGDVTVDTYYAAYDDGTGVFSDLRYLTVCVDSAADEDATHFKTLAGAVAAVASGGTIHVAAGTYNESVTLEKPVSLIGPETGPKPLVVGMITATHTTGWTTRIENINFKVNATDTNNLKLVGVKNLTVKGCDFDAAGRFMTVPQVVAVQLGGTCQNITFDTCTFRDGYYVTIQGRADNLLVKDSDIADCKSGINIQSAYGAGLIVTNTDISVVAQGTGNDTYCVRFGSEGGTAQNMSITGGTLTVDTNGLTPDAGTYFHAIVVREAATGTLTVSDATINGEIANLSATPLNGVDNLYYVVYVDDNYNDTTSGWGQYAFASIQDAINAVQPSGRVAVATGTYTQSVTVNKSLDLIAVGAATIIGTATDAVTIAADNVDITGFTIQNPNGLRGIYALNHNHLTVSGNIIENIGAGVATPSSVPCGVMIYSTSAAVDDVVLTDNIIRGIKSNGNTRSANGIWVGDSTGNFDITGLVVQDNVISNVVASPSTFADGGRGAYGIIINHASTGTGRTVAPLIKDNLITDLDGVWAHAIGLEGNTPGAVVQGNTIARIIDHKSPTEPDAVGIMVEDNLAAADVLIVSNRFSEVLVGVRNDMADSVTANANYWGSATPDIDSLILGDVVAESFYADEALTDLRYYVVYVDDSFDTESGNRFKTVEGGVNAVSVYGTVHVAAGSYDGATLTKSVKLLGANAGVAGYGTRADEAVITSIINMTGKDTTVMIDGFKFNVTPHLMLGANHAESKQTADWTFQNNLVEASGAIYSDTGYDNLNWRDVVVTRNRFVNMDSNAVSMFNVRSLTATDNQFDTLGNGHNALVFQNGGSLTVAGNSFSNIGWNAVQLVGATNVTITNNICSNLGAEAFKLGGPIENGVCSYNTIIGANTTGEQDVGGIRVRVAAGQPYNVEIIGNYIENSFNGIAVRDGDVLAGTTITVAQNTLVDNSNAGIYNGGTAALAVSANYWGTEFGPSGTGFFGTGDAIIGPVDIESYYTDAALTTLHFYDLYVDDSFADDDLDSNHFRTIQAAYAAANPGDTIHVAAGTYAQASTLTLAKRGLTLTGASRDDVKIDVSACDGSSWGIRVKADDVTLEHFTVIPKSETDGGYPIHVANTPGTLSNITLRDIKITGSYRTPFDFNGVNNLVLDGLIASGAAYGSGIGLTGCVGVTITGCQTADNAWGGVRVSGSKNVVPNRPSSDVNVDFTANTFAEVNALYIENDGLNSTANATGYSYKLTTSAGTTTYLEQDYTEAQAIAVALAAESTFPGLTVTGIYDTAGNQVPFDGEVGTAIVYVDDDWAGTTAGAGVQKPGAPAGTYLQFGRNAFATVQGGVDGVDEAGTVYVAAGLYAEDIMIDRPLALIGPNADKTGFDPTRGDEALLVPSEIWNADSSPREWDFNAVMVIGADDVTVRGFTISGDNPLLDGYDYVGMNIEVGFGVYSEGNNIEIRNNIIEKFTVVGYLAGGTYDSQWQDLVVAGNLLDSIHDVNMAGYGMAMYIQGTAGVITNNLITNSRTGIQIQPYQVVGETTLLSDNVFEVWLLGIYYNYAKNGASAWTISENEVVACTPPVTMAGPIYWMGIIIETMYAASNGGLISNNLIDGEIALSDPSHDNWRGYASGVWGIRYRTGSSDKINITGNTLTNLAYGYVHTAPVNIVLTNNNLSANDAAIAVLPLEDPQDYGTHNVDATGGNIINGVDTTTATLEQLYAIEDVVYHKVDNPAVGLVRIREDNLYVTQSSGSIQRGIDAATDGDTVNVAAGTFNEKLTINKPLTLLGANANVPFGSRGAETKVQQTDGSTIMTVVADNVTINGFELYGPLSNNAITSQNNPDGRSNLTFAFNHVHDVGTTRGSGNIYGFHYMLAGDTPSGIAVTDNLFENIGNATALGGHAGGIYFGQSTSTGTLDDVLIERNIVRNVAVTEENKNSWGIVIGVGWNSTGTATDLVIRNNEVSGISGGYAAGIALGGNTPGALVSNNTVTDITSASHPEATAAVLVETNTGAGTSVITGNDLSGATCGILNKTDFAVTAVSNWFGSATGPTSALNAGGSGTAVVNTGNGSVDMSPWLGSGLDDNDSAIGFQPATDAGVFYLPASLAFTQQPGGADLGETLSSQPIVAVYDEIGQIATQFVGTITLALGNNPGAGVLTGTLTKLCVAGQASFTDLAVTLDGGTGFTLVASAAEPIAGVTSAAFDIENPLPVLGAMNPIFTAAGSGDLTLTLSGSGFVKSSVVKWGESETLVPTAVDADSITVTVPANLLTTAGTAAVTVFSPAAGGGTSSALTFTITPDAQASEVWVDDDWTGYGDCGDGLVWGYNAFKTIQSAVTAVAVNGKVNIRSGTYAETFTTDKIVNYVGVEDGSGGGLPTVLGSITINVPTSPDAASRIENIYFKSGGGAACLVLENIDGGVTVSNCTFNGDGKFKNAIDLNSGVNGNYLTVEDSVFTGGFYLAINGTAKEVTVRRTLISGVKSGINTQSGATDLVVEDCDITVSVQSATNSSYGVRFSSKALGAGHNLTITGSRIAVDPNGFEINPAEHRAIWVRAGASGTLQVANNLIDGYVANDSTGILDASGNWWGSADAADVVGNVVAGSVDYSPWLAVGTDTDGGALGFKGDFSALYVDDGSAQAGTVGRIQEGIDLVATNGTVNVLAGTYNESVALDKPLTLTGPATGDKPLLVGMITGTYTGGLATRIENIDFKVNANDKYNLNFVGVTNLTVKGCAFNADGRFMGSPNAVAVQLDHTCQDIMIDACTFTNGYYIAIQNTASVDGLLVKDCLIDNCKSGVNVQHASGEGVTVTNCEINVVAQGTGNDTYCVRFGSKSGLAQNLNIAGCVFTVDRNGLTPDAGTYFNAVIVREAALGTLALSQSSIQGGVVNLSETLLTAENNWFGDATGPANATNPGGLGDTVTGAVDFSPWLGDGEDTQPEVIGFQPNLTPVYYLPTSLAFTQQPGGVALGAALNPQPVVTVYDEIGQIATQFVGAVTLAIGNNPGEPVAGELSGTVTLPVANGMATFSDLAIIKGTGDGYTLVASTEGLPAVTSAAFDIENSAPVLAPIGNKAVDEEALLTFTATATDTAADLVAQTLTFSLSGEVPEGASITTNGVFTWTPTEEQGGANYTFTVVVTDNGTGRLSDSETITITVNEVNVAPTLQGVPTTQLSVDEQPAEALTFTATATDQDRPAQTLTFSLVVVEGENYPTGAEIVTTSTGVGTAEGAFSWEPTEEQGGMTYVVDVVVTDDGIPAALATTQRVTIVVNEVNVAPELAPIPPQSVNFGQTLTFTASATDDDLPAQTLTYTMTGGVPEGATLDSSTGVFTWTPTEEQAKANYSFTITVTDSGDPVLSDEQTVTIGAISAAHSCPGYWSPSTSMVVSNTFAFGGTLTNLTWTPVLPNAGWVITAADAGGNGAVVVTNDGTAVAFTTLPTASPVVFTYTVSVPGNQAVSNSLGAVVSFNGLAAEVAPIAIFRYHSADYRRDLSGETAGQFRKIDSTEINRVLSYWRLGYKPDAAGYDGFSAASGYTGTEAAHHSADVNKNWAISLGELLPVQNYWRSGGYHVDLTTADGYAADRAGIGPSLFALAGISVAGQTAPSGYNPGETLQVTYTFDPAGASLKALGWELDLPDGWVIESVSGDAKPTFARNEIVCNAAVLPASTVTVTLTLRVPLTEIRTVTLGGTALVITDGNNAVDSYAMEAAALAPVDEDNNGMADSWERAFAGDAGTLDPDADLDGDTMSNLNEYLCGTLPNDAESVLKMVAVQTSADGTMQVSWASVAGRTYTLQRADGSPAAANFKAIQTGIAADPSGRNVYIDRDVDGPQARFYRVVLEE